MLETKRQEQVASPIRWLNELDQTALAEAGGKGANLGEMTRAGLPVPPGFVITTEAYRAVLAANGLDERIAGRLQGLNYHDVAAVTVASQAISTWIRDAEMPQSIEMEIRQAYTKLSIRMEIFNEDAADAAATADAAASDVAAPTIAAAAVVQPAWRVAVRSSATAEDLPNASFAGQQETFLNICTPAAVLDAVQKCWASLWTVQAMTYRANLGFDQMSVALAVVVQSMVPADVAGVMFTANPVTGRRDEILISASYGLGESVVSGAVTPDTFILSMDGAVLEQVLGAKEMRVAPNGCGTQILDVPPAERERYCLNPVQLSALAEMAKRVQAHYSSPQDTEWAFRDGTLYLLQARPITTLKPDGSAPVGTTQAVVMGPEPSEPPVMPRPPRGIENTIDHMPEPLMPLDIALVINDSFNLFFEKLGFRPPAERGSAVERPDGRIAIKLSEPGLSPALLWKFPAHLLFILRTDPMTNWAPLNQEILHWIQYYERERQGIADPVQLARLITRSFAEFEQLFARRFLAAFFPGIINNSLVSYWVRKAVGKADAPELDNRLYRGTPYPTALQNQAVIDLAHLLCDNGKDSAAFQAGLQRFLSSWGNRPVRGMIALPSSPTWAEQPEVVAQMVEALAATTDGIKTSAEEQTAQFHEYQNARARVEASLNPLFRRWFRLHLARARKALVVREEGLSRAEDYNAFLRRAVLQLGRMLADLGTLAQAEEVFYLLLEELEPAARGSLIDIADRVTRRKQGYKKLLAAHAHGQHWLYATGSIPAPETFQDGRTFAGNALKGLAASQGEVIGLVRVIHGPEEFGQMRKGEILVAPFTAPAWTPLFSLAAAVVTDIGSLASHAAIVAREYGIPCVVAVNGATKTLHDGQLVQVDGTRGTITVLDKNNDSK